MLGVAIGAKRRDTVFDVLRRGSDGGIKLVGVGLRSELEAECHCGRDDVGASRFVRSDGGLRENQRSLRRQEPLGPLLADGERIVDHAAVIQAGIALHGLHITARCSRIGRKDARADVRDLRIPRDLSEDVEIEQAVEIRSGCRQRRSNVELDGVHFAPCDELFRLEVRIP